MTEPKKIKFEDMKDLNYGDLIIIDDPAMGTGTSYAFMSKAEGKFYFITGYGASLMVSSQDTIDGFSVKLIDDTHPLWDAALSSHGKEVGRMLDQFEMKDKAANSKI